LISKIKIKRFSVPELKLYNLKDLTDKKEKKKEKKKGKKALIYFDYNFNF
jgi:hypothetical protein